MYHKILQLTLLQLFSVIVSRDNVKSTGFKTFYDNNLHVSATASITLNTTYTVGLINTRHM